MLKSKIKETRISEALKNEDNAGAYRLKGLEKFIKAHTDEVPGFFLSLKNHTFIARSEDTILLYRY